MDRRQQDDSKWSGSGIPGAADTATISGLNAGATIMLDGAQSVSGLTIASNNVQTNVIAQGSGSGGLTIGSGGVTTSGNQSKGISADIVLGAAQTWNIGNTNGLSVSGVVSGGVASESTALTKTGAQLLTLSGNNTYSGKTDVTTGTLRAGHTNALGTSGSGHETTVAVSGTISLGASNIPEDISVANAMTTFAASSLAGQLTLAPSPPVVLISINTQSGTLTLAGKVTGSGGINKTGLANLVLSNNTNDYNGNTVVNSAASNTGILLGADNVIPHGAGKGDVVVNTGFFDLNGHSETINGLTTTSGSTAGIVTNSAVGTWTLSVGDNDATSSFAGKITNSNNRPLALTKFGDGTLTVSNTANDYQGNTIVDDGVLKLGASGVVPDGANKGSVDIGTVGVLDLNGHNETINGLSGTGTVGNTGATATLTIASGNTVAPATTTTSGIFSTVNIAYAASTTSVFDVDLNGTTPSSGYDQLQVTGTVDLGTATILNVSINPAAQTATNFVIIQNDGSDAVTGTFAGKAEGGIFPVGSQFFTISYRAGDGNDVVLMENGAPVVWDQSFTVDENAANGAAVGTVMASDPNPGATLIYSITAGNGDGAFAIDANSGAITVADGTRLNHEAANQRQLTVQVSDSQLTDTAAITIGINNVNEAPRIDMDRGTFGSQVFTEFRIGPDRTTDEKKKFILRVEASDDDAQETLTYSIVSGNTNGTFAINPNTGEITLAKEWSEAEVPIFDLVVRVTDASGASETGQARMHVSNTSVGIAGDTQAIEGTSDFIRLKFVRQSADISSALTVQFSFELTDPMSDLKHPGRPLEALDLEDGPGKAALLAGSVDIPANQDEVTIELHGVNDASIEGLEGAKVTVVETPSYAVVRSSVDPKDPGFKKNAMDVFSWVPLQVLDNITRFADGVPADPDGILVHYNDVKQGSVGDCFFHVALAQLAKLRPTFTLTAISEDGATANPFDYLVRFFDADGNPYIVNVDLDLNRGHDAVELSGDFDAQGAVEVWTLVMEQAFAQVQGGYDQIDTGGHTDTVWELLTGENASRENLQGPLQQDTDQQIYDKIKTARDAGKGVMLGTLDSPPYLVGNHAYFVLEASADSVTLYNPHGGDAGQVVISKDALNENLQTLYIGDAP